MKIIDLLRKLGILRFGTYKGTYKNEIPDQMLFDDVYDSEKDLVHRKDKKTKSSEEKGSEQ
jgi:hypothetical protein